MTCSICLPHDPRLDLTRIATALKAIQRQLIGMIGPIATATCVAGKRTADRGLAAPKLLVCDQARYQNLCQFVALTYARLDTARRASCDQ